MLISDIGAPYLEGERHYCECPICRGTGHGLGEFTAERCPACEGAGEVETPELKYIKRTYVSAEYYWGLPELEDAV